MLRRLRIKFILINMLMTAIFDKNGEGTSV